MNLNKLLRSAPFRFALAYAALFAASVIVLFVIIFWSTVGGLEEHLEHTVNQQIAALRDDLRQVGQAAMLELVRGRLEDQENTTLHYLVQDASGNKLVGDLPAVKPGTGWQVIALPKATEDRNDSRDQLWLRARGELLDDDTYLLVGHDTRDLVKTRNLVLEAFALALAATVILALAGGVVLGAALLRRVDAINQTAQGIMAGDLSRRIPRTNTGDELDRLAANLNVMLSRIEALMESLRHVTNDIAHDLRTPLGRLRQRLEAARLKAKSIGEYETVVDRTIADTDAVLKTFNALLRIAQIEAGVQRSQFVGVNLTAVLDTLVEAYEAVAEDNGQQLQGVIIRGVIVSGNRELLTQMAANLIENALRHTSLGSTVMVLLDVRRRGVRVIISDSGPGIPEAQRDKVFRRFYRLDTSRSTSGSGLGLSLVAAVAKLHDIAIDLDDNRPGLRVTLQFPRTARA